jgi:hypothetical protein
MKHKTLAIFAVLALFCIGPIGVHAEEDEEDEDRFGFGIQEREREREHSEENSSPFSGVILYVTIGAIVAAIGYTAFKLARSRKATAKLR